MIISKQADYAIRTMIELGKSYPESILIKDIATTQEIPKPFLNKIIQTLAKSGLVETIRGAQGGVRLWVAPEKITLKNIIEAVDGPIAINRCLMGNGMCARQKLCAAHRALAKAKALFLAELDKSTLQKLIDDQMHLDTLSVEK